MSCSETAGRSLEEIDAIFAESKSIFDPPRVARRLPKQHLVDLAVGDKVDGLKQETEHVEVKTEV